MRLSAYVAIAALLTTPVGVSAARAAGITEASSVIATAPAPLPPGDYYVVSTTFYTQATCESYWNTFINKDGNWNLYSSHRCLPNTAGRWTLLAYYR